MASRTPLCSVFTVLTCLRSFTCIRNYPEKMLIELCVKHVIKSNLSSVMGAERTHNTDEDIGENVTFMMEKWCCILRWSNTNRGRRSRD